MILTGPFRQEKSLATYLKGLSTYGRFCRFVNDFRKKEGYKLKFEKIELKGEEYLSLS